MRYYTIPRGKYKGCYEIYESREEFKAAGKGDFKIWNVLEFDNSIQAGDWIEAMDGFIVLLLDIYYPFAKAKKVTTDLYQLRRFFFPMAGISVYTKKNGTIKANAFYALFTFPDKYSLSNARPWIRKFSKDDNKILFANLVISGVPIIKAVKQIYNVNNQPAERHISNNTYTKIGEKLMSDKLVQRTMVNALDTFTEKLMDIYPIEKVVKEIEILIDKSPKGSKTHRENIEFLMKLQGLSQGIDIPDAGGHSKEPTKFENAEDAEFNEIDNQPLPTE